MDKQKFKILTSGNKLPKIFVMLLTLHYLFFIFFGFEVTDTGFHLSKQWGMYHGLWKGNFDAIAGTNIIGGLWLLIPGKPLLIWSRLGYIIIQILTAYFSFKILLLYFKPFRVFAVCLVVSISLSFWQYYFTINYDNLPLIFLLLSIYLILKENKTPSKHNRAVLITAGVLIIISIFCKITYLPAVLLPIIAVYTNKNVNSAELKRKKMTDYFYGIMIGTAVLILFMALSGGFYPYMEYFNNAVAEFLTKKDLTEKLNLTRDHSMNTLYSMYKISFIKIVNISVMSVLVTVLFGYFYFRINKNNIFKVMFFVISGWFYYYQIFEPSPNHGILSFTLTLIIIRMITSRTEDLKIFSEPVTVSILIYLISFLGSDLGISAGFRSGSIVLLVSLAILLVYDAKFISGNFKQSYTFLFYISLVLFSVFYIQDDYKHYQDLNFEFMTESFKTPQLSGIKSNKVRVQTVDSLLNFLNKDPNLKFKKVFFSKHSPMFYYLTEAKYTLNSPWDTLNELEDIKADFSNVPPEIFVLPKGSHRDFRWPDCDAKWAESDGGEKKAQRYYDYYYSFIKENNYLEVYKNSFYTVYSLELEGKNDGQ